MKHLFFDVGFLGWFGRCSGSGVLFTEFLKSGSATSRPKWRPNKGHEEGGERIRALSIYKGERARETEYSKLVLLRWWGARALVLVSQTLSSFADVFGSLSGHDTTFPSVGLFCNGDISIRLVSLRFYMLYLRNDSDIIVRIGSLLLSYFFLARFIPHFGSTTIHEGRKWGKKCKKSLNFYSKYCCLLLWIDSEKKEAFSPILTKLSFQDDIMIMYKYGKQDLSHARDRPPYHVRFAECGGMTSE